MTEDHIKIYHHPNPEIKSFLTMEGISPPCVEFFQNPLNQDQKDRLQGLGALASQIVMDIMALQGVREIRIKPKEIRMKKEEDASWNDIEDKVRHILSTALRKKQIKSIYSGRRDPFVL